MTMKWYNESYIISISRIDNMNDIHLFSANVDDNGVYEDTNE